MFFSAVTNKQVLHKLNDNTLSINGKVLQFEDSIYGLAISDSVVIVLAYEIETNGEIYADKVPRNNIRAYDYSGNYLWNIWDIIKEVALPEEADFPFGLLVIHSKDSIEKAKYPLFDYKGLDKSHDYLCCSNSGGMRYIIDINEKVVLDRQGFRF